MNASSSFDDMVFSLRGINAQWENTARRVEMSVPDQLDELASRLREVGESWEESITELREILLELDSFEGVSLPKGVEEVFTLLRELSGRADALSLPRELVFLSEDLAQLSPTTSAQL